jgi:entry exclusion lipoprotein TrbK
MKLHHFLVTFLLASGAVSGCSQRSDIASPDCAELATGKLNEAQQIELAKKCPRAGPPFKPSPERKW